MGIEYTSEQKLDAKDKKIISALMENARYSIAEIAKKTGLRRDSVIYRIKKLSENKVIKGYQPIINPPALGYPNLAIILLKTKTINQKAKQDFINKIKSLPNVIHIFTLLGRFEYYLAVLYKTHEQLHLLLEEIRQIIPDYVQDYDILQVVDEPKFENMIGIVMEK